ncbi:hypothetical protein [Aromatoleum anaerobium]|uniref:hypothetical protein n=1 Tax=Aromatoleum anaerobium TaxID=182180 RepID=UPI001FF5F2F8|nr:hypothetical protein [Aromatoleum anaerobium]MCK0509357.1 hypothetical protein [Aromatoleum anaerobium]
MTASRVLALLIAALFAVLAWVWIAPLGPWQPPQPVVPEVSRVQGEAGGAASAALAHALARPVFWPSRRPEAEPSHVLPRWEGDGLALAWPAKNPPREALEEMAAKLRAVI